MKLAAIADQIVAGIKYPDELKSNGVLDWDRVRDACDIATGSNLCTSYLNKLADMVQRRLDPMPPRQPVYRRKRKV